MLLGDPLASSLRLGDAVSLSGAILAEDCCLFRATWHDEQYVLQGSSLPMGKWTLYRYKFLGWSNDRPILGRHGDSHEYPQGECKLGSFRAIVELCSGMGGMAIGAARLGGETILQVDKSPLAAQTVRQNGGTYACVRTSRPRRCKCRFMPRLPPFFRLQVRLR